MADKRKRKKEREEIRRDKNPKPSPPPSGPVCTAHNTRNCPICYP